MYPGKFEREGRGSEGVESTETLTTQCRQILRYLQGEADRRPHIGATLDTLMREIRFAIQDFSVQPSRMYPVADMLQLAKFDQNLGPTVVIETPDRSKPWHVGARRGKRGIEILIHR